MRYLVMDQAGHRVEVDAGTATSAREKAKRQMQGRSIGELSVWEKLDPAQANRAATQEFFGMRPPIIL